jgi:hypothetical protein
VALNYKTSIFAKNSITPMIQSIFPIPETAKSHLHKIVPFSVSLFLTPKPKGGRP